VLFTAKRLDFPIIRTKLFRNLVLKTKQNVCRFHPNRKLSFLFYFRTTPITCELKAA